jgi:chitinase
MRLAKFICALLALAMTMISRPVLAATNSTGAFAAYFESWISNTGDNFDTDLINVPKGVTIVMLAFIRPDAQYSGNLELSGTGLEFGYSGPTLRNSILELRKRNPSVEVFLSIGGESYIRWDKLNVAGIARFVRDFELDGVDIDFEPPDPGCVQTSTSISCRTDPLLQRTVNELRRDLPKPVRLSLTSGATGAFGDGEWKYSGPTGGPDYGTMVQFLRSPAAREIDFVNIMAYDAGEEYDPLEGLEAFQHYYSGPILLGFSPPPEAWGDHAYSKKELKDILETAMTRGAAGAMLFSLRKGTGSGSFTPYVGMIDEIMKRSRN